MMTDVLFHSKAPREGVFSLKILHTNFKTVLKYSTRGEVEDVVHQAVKVFRPDAWLGIKLPASVAKPN
jgi:hypothetical protein